MVDSDLTLRIEHVDGTTSELVVPTPTAIDENQTTLSTIATGDVIDDLETAEASVFRDSWLGVADQLDRRNDEIYIEAADGSDIFGGRLDDWQFSGTLVSLQMDSFERDGHDVEPPVLYEATAMADDAIANELIDLMEPPLYPGTVENTVSTIDYDAPNRPPMQMLRELANSTGAEIEVHPDGAVDYVNRRGQDRAVTISPSTAAVISSPRIRRTMREEVTNVRAVSEEDESIYEEATAISTGTDEREVWRVARIDSTSSSRIQAHATMRANEYADEPEYIEVDTTLDPDALGLTPEVGDRFPLSLPAYGIDHDVRVIEADRVIDGDGDQVDVLLSNRKLTLRGR